MAKEYKCRFDYSEVQGGAIITEYENDGTPIVSVAEDSNIALALGHILYSEISEGAKLYNAKVTIKIEEL